MATATLRVLTYLVTLTPKDTGDVSSVWNADRIAKAFTEANRVWKQADIAFAPEAPITKTVAITVKDGGDTWPDFVNSLSPANRKCLGVGFLYDLPGPEGGDGGGRIALISGLKTGGDDAFAGNLLAHELGHVLIDDPLHKLAKNDPANLMYGKRSDTKSRPEKLEADQIKAAQETAKAFA